MKIDKLIIKNYKIFSTVKIFMNNDVNIFVGENDSGKTTILEALSLVLTGKVNGVNINSILSIDLFNADTRKEFKEHIEKNQVCEPPSIVIEAYFSDPKDDDVETKKYRGTNNSLHEDVCGIKVEIRFDEQYSAAYTDLLNKRQVKDIPIEYYKATFSSFAMADYYINKVSKFVTVIDTNKKDYSPYVTRFVSGVINEYLSVEDIIVLRQAYRSNRSFFCDNNVVKEFNQKLNENHRFDSRKVSLNLREYALDNWKREMSVSIDEIPLENLGLGTQNMFKTEIFLGLNEDLEILLMEEPENNLSYTNMNKLISRLHNCVSEINTKQIFLSTHSSFVANRLGLGKLHLVSNGQVKSFNDLSRDTYEYFMKLPGYNTLRVLLAEKVILVEGPADEMILQRAYRDKYNSQPIDNGVDIISIGGISFERYCELAQVINKRIVIVTDNDGDVDSVNRKYSKFSDLVTLCVENDNNLKTLEPSVLNVNKGNIGQFGNIVCRKGGYESEESLLKFMSKNKTDWSLRVFLAEIKINYPAYILKAISSYD